MTYTLTVALATGTAGQTLSAQLVDTTGSNVGSAVTSGFVDLGAGFYSWTYASFPDGFRGTVKFSAAGTVQTVAAINPQEAEYTDVKASSRAAAGAIVAVASPVHPTTLAVELLRGDDYTTADGRQLTWNATGWPDLTDATIAFTANRGRYSFTGTGTVVSPTGSQQVAVEIDGTDTQDLPAGTYQYDVQATLAGGSVVTLAAGRLSLIADQTA